MSAVTARVRRPRGAFGLGADPAELGDGAFGFGAGWAGVENPLTALGVFDAFDESALAYTPEYPTPCGPSQLDGGRPDGVSTPGALGRIARPRTKKVVATWL